MCGVETVAKLAVETLQKSNVDIQVFREQLGSRPLMDLTSKGDSVTDKSIKIGAQAYNCQLHTLELLSKGLSFNDVGKQNMEQEEEENVSNGIKSWQHSSIPNRSRRANLQEAREVQQMQCNSTKNQKKQEEKMDEDKILAECNRIVERWQFIQAGVSPPTREPKTPCNHRQCFLSEASFMHFVKVGEWRWKRNCANLLAEEIVKLDFSSRLKQTQFGQEIRSAQQNSTQYYKMRTKCHSGLPQQTQNNNKDKTLYPQTYPQVLTWDCSQSMYEQICKIGNDKESNKYVELGKETQEFKDLYGIYRKEVGIARLYAQKFAIARQYAQLGKRKRSSQPSNTRKTTHVVVRQEQILRDDFHADDEVICSPKKRKSWREQRKLNQNRSSDNSYNNSLSKNTIQGTQQQFISTASLQFMDDTLEDELISSRTTNRKHRRKYRQLEYDEDYRPTLSSGRIGNFKVETQVQNITLQESQHTEQQGKQLSRIRAQKRNNHGLYKGLKLMSPSVQQLAEQLLPQRRSFIQGELDDEQLQAYFWEFGRNIYLLGEVISNQKRLKGIYLSSLAVNECLGQGDPRNGSSSQKEKLKSAYKRQMDVKAGGMQKQQLLHRSVHLVKRHYRMRNAFRNTMEIDTLQNAIEKQESHASHMAVYQLMYTNSGGRVLSPLEICQETIRRCQVEQQQLQQQQQVHSQLSQQKQPQQQLMGVPQITPICPQQFVQQQSIFNTQSSTSPVLGHLGLHNSQQVFSNYHPQMTTFSQRQQQLMLQQIQQQRASVRPEQLTQLYRTGALPYVLQHQPNGVQGISPRINVGAQYGNGGMVVSPKSQLQSPQLGILSQQQLIQSQIFESQEQSLQPTQQQQTKQ